MDETSTEVIGRNKILIRGFISEDPADNSHAEFLAASRRKDRWYTAKIRYDFSGNNWGRRIENTDIAEKGSTLAHWASKEGRDVQYLYSLLKAPGQAHVVRLTTDPRNSISKPVTIAITNAAVLPMLVYFGAMLPQRVDPVLVRRFDGFVGELMRSAREIGGICD